jgi:methionine-rich copper-binding protein CopC
MKKFALWATALSAAVVLVFVGCNNPTSSDNTPAPPKTGVLGQVAGLVFDSASGLVLEGASVSIGGYPVVKTDVAGTYIIQDVTPGTYNLTVSKDGYGSYSYPVTVNVDEYLAQDPYREWALLQQQLAWFTTWLGYQDPTNVNFAPTDPYAGLDALLDGTWTYQDGMFVSGDGTTSIVVNNTAGDTAEAPEFPVFEIVQNKLDYTYSYGIPVGFIMLNPLTGGFSGTFDVVFETLGNSASQPVTGTAPIKDGVEIFFTDIVPVGLGTGDTTRIYGPFVTKDGGFTADSLPANTRLRIKISAFVQTYQDVEYYFDAQEFYAPNDFTTVVAGIWTTETGNARTEEGSTGHLNVGKYFIFTVGNVAFVVAGEGDTATNVPNADSPLPVNGSIRLNFNKPISVGSFIATLNVTNGNNVPSGTDNILGSSWSADRKTVTLTARTKFDNYANVSLPYTSLVGDPVGTLSLVGTADDGSDIYLASGTGIPVYTESGLTAIGVEYIPFGDSSLPPRAAAAQLGGAIKLTFNKPINLNYPGTSFTIDGLKADYRAGTANTEVFVFTDWEIDAGVVFTYLVAATADTGDYIEGTISDLTVGPGSQLILTGTNLYTNAAGIPQTPAATAIFPIDKSIEFTFASIPTGVAAGDVVVELRQGTALVTTTVGLTGTKVTITPAAPLTINTPYTINLSIIKDGAALYKNPVTVGAQGPVFINGSSLITFTASGDYPYAALTTNLYTTYDGLVNTPSATAYFPVDGAIDITFDKAIATGIKAIAVLDNDTANPLLGVIAGAKVTITPVLPLTAAAHTLQLRLVSGDGVPYYVTPTTAGAHPFYISGGNISFTTILPNRIIAKSTNLYTGDNGIPQNPGNTDAIFPVDKPIEITFNSPIPDGYRVFAELRETSNIGAIINANAVYTGDKVTITPYVTLKRNTQYFLTLRIYNAANTVYYQNPATNGTAGPLFIASNVISFRTSAQDILVLVNTNLYTDSDGIPHDPPTADPAAGAGYFPVNNAFEFIFNDTIPAGSKVFAELKEGANVRETDFALDEAKLTITPKVTLKRDTLYNLTLIIYNAQNVKQYENPATAGVNGQLYINAAGIAFRTANEDVLILTGTNLYTEANGIVHDPAATAYFPVDGTLEFTFNDDIPTGAVVTAELKAGATLVDTDVTHTGAVVKVDPKFALGTNTAHTLDLKIQDSTRKITYYANPTNNGTSGPLFIDSNLISFTTANTAQLTLLRTNLYINPATNQPVDAADDLDYFAVDGNIQITFNEDIPADAEITAVLKDANYNTQSAVVSKNGRIITINPDADLKPGTIYYLQLKVVSGNDKKITLYDLPTATNNSVAVAQQFNVVPFSDTAYYIVFNTVQSKKATLVSTNALYKDNNPANNAVVYFPVNGKFELTFDAIPAGTTISAANTWLSTNNTGTSLTPVTAALDIQGKKVTITPNAKLTSGTAYYLRLVLDGPGGATDVVYEPKARDNAFDVPTSGVVGPVYIDDYDNPPAINHRGSIQVTTSELAIVPPGALSKTNISAGTGGSNTTFAVDNDIIIEFNQPITTVTKAQLLYVDSGFVYGVTASATLADLTQGGTVLTIHVPNLLGPSTGFYVRLKVSSGTGETLVYDPTDTGVAASYVGGVINGNYAAITTVSTINPVGNSKSALKPAGLSLAVTLDGTTTAPPIPKTDNTVRLTLTPIDAPVDQDYALYRAYQGVWSNTADVTVFTSVPANDVTPIDEDGFNFGGLSGAHIDAEGIQYKVGGVDGLGFAIESDAITLTFN